MYPPTPPTLPPEPVDLPVPARAYGDREVEWPSLPTLPVGPVVATTRPVDPYWLLDWTWACPCCGRANTQPYDAHPAVAPDGLRRRWIEPIPFRCASLTCQAGFIPVCLMPYDGVNVYRFVCRRPYHTPEPYVDTVR